ncbi:hypothetical protein [Cerasicoccus arenae]|uniref:hypothetical protein n=1 Tax=Cerasicoccus arenae TaxID=424488 RepID=UPI001A35185E|nr:hypothetical protein [Cerasicoccus arenae]MBK1859627.1 hypothetical protein [Cerasicoccus arenae]
MFYIPVVTWHKAYVVSDEDYYYDLDDEEIAELSKELGGLAFKGNLWVRYVNYLWPVLLLVYVLYGAYQRKRLKQIDDEYFGSEQS